MSKIQAPEQKMSFEKTFPSKWTTQELKFFLGDFEERYENAWREEPEIVRYGGLLQKGLVRLMKEMKTANFYEEPYPYMEAKIPGYPTWTRLVQAMRELQDRREYARKKELQELDKIADMSTLSSTMNWSKEESGIIE